jgi:hypothetical protein
MPKKSYPYPFGEPKRIDTLVPLKKEQVQELIAISSGNVTIEVAITGIGAGYLFHIENRGDNIYALHSYASKRLPGSLNIDLLTRFINHTSGLRFDTESWLLSTELDRVVGPEDEDKQDETDEDSDGFEAQE